MAVILAFYRPWFKQKMTVLHVGQPGMLIRPRADAKQAFLAANQELSLADRRRGKTFLAEFVLTDELKFRSGPHDADLPLVAEKIDQPVGRNQ